MRRKVAALVVLVLALGFALGRWAAPARVEFREKEHVEAAKAEAHQAEAANSKAFEADTRAASSVHERTTIKRPDGTTVEHDVTRKQEAASNSKAKESEAKREAETRIETKFVDREVVKIVEGNRPQWSLEARSGLGVDARVHYGGAVSRRLLGPLWVGVWAASTKEAGVSVRIEW